MEKDVEEILERAERRGRRRVSAPAWLRKPRRVGGPGGAQLTSWVFAIALILLVTSLFLRSMIVWLALGGVALLLLGYWLAMRNRGAVPVGRGERVITPLRLLVTALILLVLGLLPPLRRWFLYFGAVAFILFVWAYWTSWPKRSSATRGSERRWRGQVVDYPESLWNRLRRWFRR
ncbi:MAG: hypothetical protein HY682_09475 [Chloroflexi bacterium]|nr:hypothetical protein [Chloroflexota bacterium]